MSATSSLCDRCSLLFSVASFNEETDQYHVVEHYVRSDTLPELLTLQKGVDEGCFFCAALKRVIVAHEWAPDASDITIGPATLYYESWWESDLKPEQEGVTMVEIVIKSAEVTQNAVFDVFAPHGSYASTQMRVRRRPPTTDRSSPEGIAVLQQMISACVSIHWQCELGHEEFWPTRVLDVGPADGTSDTRLVVTSGRPSQYFALSHCWGLPGPGIRTLKTTTTLMQSHMRGIPLDSMPKNFQHAVLVTRALGFRYLWIDSLCIIQDSKDDWAAEGSQMDKIYRHAFVTLAATSASTSEDGFLDYALKDRTFSIRPRRSQDQTSAPYGEDDIITVRFMESTHHDRMEPDVEESTWNKRGWTLQERHLSRRIIHFSRTQIFWECRRGFASECGQRILRLPCSITRVYGANDSSDDSDYSSDGEDSSPEKDENISEDTDDIVGSITDEQTMATRASLYNWWFQILADYSRRKLTYASDKFPAISGLVKELHAAHFDITQREDQYVAGVWIGALADCLLWMPEDPAQMIHPGTYRAPTWSWAHCDGAIIPSPMGYPDLTPDSSLVEYLGHEPVFETSDKHGRIKSALLRLRASIIRIRSGEICVGADTTRRRMTLIDGAESQGFIRFDHVKSVTYEIDTDELYAMPVKVQKLSLSDRSGLVLRRGNVPDTFERVGVFQLDQEHLGAFLSAGKETVTLV